MGVRLRFRGVLSLETIVRGRSDLLVEDLASELVILDPISADIHHLDRQASVVWRLLKEASNIRSIIDAIVDATGADQASVATDVSTLVEQLIGLGLVAPHRNGT